MRVRILTVASTNLRFKVIRPAGGSAYTGVSTSAPRVLPVMGDTVVTFPTQQPISTGDQIALSVTAAAPGVATPPQAEVTAVRWDPPLADGETRTPTTTLADSFEVLLNADIEPDCDVDTLGDETQDSDTSSCAPSADTTAPDTTITKRPKDKTKKKQATFEFSANEAGASFECSLDSGAFAPCISPHVVKVKKGKHSFAVRAKDAAGNTDGSPATDSWKVKKKKRR